MMRIQNNDNDQNNIIKRVSAKMSENFPNENDLLNNPVIGDDINDNNDDDDIHDDNLDVRKFYNKLKSQENCLVDEFNLDYDDHMYTTNNSITPITTITTTETTVTTTTTGSNNSSSSVTNENSDLINQTDLIGDNCQDQITTTTATLASAAATASTTTTTPESEVKFWKEWLILHLDLIQQQSDEILDKERTILILQQENEMLKERISCMERGAPFQPNKFYNNYTTTTQTYLEQNSIDDDNNMTQDSNVCDEDNKNCLELLDLNNCENGQTDLKLIDFETNTPITTAITTTFGTKQHSLSNTESQTEINQLNINNNSDNPVVISDSIGSDQQLEDKIQPRTISGEDNEVTAVEEDVDVAAAEEDEEEEDDDGDDDEEEEVEDEEVEEEEEEDEGVEHKKTTYEIDNLSDNKNMKKIESEKFNINNNSNNSEKFDFTINHIKDFDSVRNLRMSIRRKRLSNSSAVSNSDTLEDKRSFRRLRKKRKKMMKDSQLLITTEQYVTQSSDMNLFGTSKVPELPIEISNNTTLEVPRWRVKVYASCYSMEGTENLDDEVFNKRHSRLENDERRRKRWDVQRIREQRVIEKLKQRQERTSSGSKIEDPIDSIQSLWPKLDDIKYLEISENLPISAFGCPIPKFSPSEFNLPWLNNPNLLVTRKTPHTKRSSTITTAASATTTRRRRR